MLDLRLCAISSNIQVYMKNRGKWGCNIFSRQKNTRQKKDKYILKSAHVQNNNATLKEIPWTQQKPARINYFINYVLRKLEMDSFQETNLIFRQLLPWFRWQRFCYSGLNFWKETIDNAYGRSAVYHQTTINNHAHSFCFGSAKQVLQETYLWLAFKWFQMWELPKPMPSVLQTNSDVWRISLMHQLEYINLHISVQLSPKC